MGGWAGAIRGPAASSSGPKRGRRLVGKICRSKGRDRQGLPSEPEDFAGPRAGRPVGWPGAQASGRLAR